MAHRPEHTAAAAAVVYEIRIRGHLGGEWSAWFGGMAIVREASGETLLTGPVADQAALFGLLRRLRDLGLPLVSVVPVESESAAGPETLPATAEQGDTS